MKAKINFTRESSNRSVRVKYTGLKKESSVKPVYKHSVTEAKQRSVTYSKVEESVMRRKFSI